MSSQKKVPVSISVTDRQAEFLKTMVNRSEVFQKFIDELMLTTGLTEAQKVDVKVAIEIAQCFIDNFLQEDADDEDEENYVYWMSRTLNFTVDWYHELRTYGDCDIYGLSNVKSKEGQELIKRVRGLKHEKLTPEDLQIMKVIFNEVRERLVRVYQKTWSKYPPRGWDKCFKLGYGYGDRVQDITPP
jgi:hypothetical protein